MRHEVLACICHAPCSDGSVYDTKKHVWLQGREAWMFACLYNERAEYHTQEILEASRLGVDFLRKHAVRSEDRRVYFCLDEIGQVQYCFASNFLCITSSTSTTTFIQCSAAARQVAAEALCRVLLCHGALGVCPRHPRQVRWPCLIISRLCGFLTSPALA